MKRFVIANLSRLIATGLILAATGLVLTGP